MLKLKTHSGFHDLFLKYIQGIDVEICIQLIHVCRIKVLQFKKKKTNTHLKLIFYTAAKRFLVEIMSCRCCASVDRMVSML